MMHRFDTVNDLRQWVTEATGGWPDREDADIAALVEAIRGRDDCPSWGRDWSEFLDSLPDLGALLDGQAVTPRSPHDLKEREAAEVLRRIQVALWWDGRTWDRNKPHDADTLAAVEATMQEAGLSPAELDNTANATYIHRA